MEITVLFSTHRRTAPDHDRTKRESGVIADGRAAKEKEGKGDALRLCWILRAAGGKRREGAGSRSAWSSMRGRGESYDA